jgi:hypothetical protein
MSGRDVVRPPVVRTARGFPALASAATARDDPAGSGSGVGRSGVTGARRILEAMWAAAGGSPGVPARVSFGGRGALPSAFAVTDLAAGSVAAAALAVAELVGETAGGTPAVAVDRRLASMWFVGSVRPRGWDLPAAWDELAGDYPAGDGWVRLHTNARRHRDAALRVLGTPADREAVAAAVRRRGAEELEAAVFAAGGCASALRTADAWAAHPQGAAVAAEPLAHAEPGDAGRAGRPGPADRPLAGVRVLDLTRVLAGPVSTRFLAGYGAEVLRIDPPGWDEPGLVPDVTAGKRCARLDLKAPGGRDRLLGLLAGADVLVHGLRPGALDGLGLGPGARRAARPGLVEVALDAWGWTGPWAGRRGFDSLVQTACGIAAAGMAWAGRDRPTPLPCQALDHAAGYLMAALAVRGLTERLRTGRGSASRTSLARVASLLASAPAAEEQVLPPETADDLAPEVERTVWGDAFRLRPPCCVEGAPMRWDLPAGPLGSAEAAWA